MQTKITETINISGLGTPANRKLLKVQSGQYAGRMMAIFKTANSEIKYSSAVNPYSSWSDMVTVASDSANAPFDVTLTASGDVYLVYIETVTNHLAFLKLSITDTGWTVGSKIYIYNGNLTNTPSIVLDKNENAYVTFSRFNGSSFDLQVKSSSDSGANWGSGPSDIGETIITGANLVISKIMTSADNVFVVYTADYQDIKERHRLLTGSSWSTEYTIGSGTAISIDFDAVVLPEGFLGVVYNDDQLIYREFNGVNWSPTVIIDSNSATYPQLRIINNVPVVFYLSEKDSNQIQLMQSSRISGFFSTPQVFETRSDIFDSVLLYDSVSSSFDEKTIEAASNTTADLIHTSSNALLQQAGDQVFIGSDDRFRFLHILLSTAGSGGTLTYSYFDGLNWIAFLPTNGNYQFDTSSRELTLWQDYDNTPETWQKNVVNGVSRFWIKIEATSAFTIAPIGSQLTSISNLKAINVRR
ncbi:MAG: hypothetical protein DWP97_06105 [Calditrichaeota bacterium]|nr:MAG: hypothetical protein DWP97_06105 [Calditrichota bacterium]